MHPGHDGPSTLCGLHFEAQSPTIHLNERGTCLQRLSDIGSGYVRDVYAGSDAGLSGLEVVAYAAVARFFQLRYHMRCRDDRDTRVADGRCRITGLRCCGMHMVQKD